MRLVAKEEEEEDEAREEVREKRRVTCVSLAAGSIAGQGSGRRRWRRPGRSDRASE